MKIRYRDLPLEKSVSKLWIIKESDMKFKYGK